MREQCQGRENVKGASRAAVGENGVEGEIRAEV